MANNQAQTEAELARKAGGVAVGTLVSRVLGFIREMVLAGVLGAGPVADAFYVAFRIPNMLRELFAEGSMSAGFIPVFTEYLHQSRAAAQQLAAAVFTTLLVLLSIVVVLGIFFSPQIVGWIAPGFSSVPDQAHLTASLTRIMFPFLLFISLAALAMGIANSLGHFTPGALSSSVFNVVSVLFIFASLPFMTHPAYGVAIGVALGGLAQCLVQLPVLHKEGFSFSLHALWPPHPGVAKIGRLLLPTLIGLSVVQVNLLVNTWLASTLSSGSVSFLYYGMRLIHFPLGIFAVALSTVLLPTLSRAAAGKDATALHETTNFALRLLFFVIAPAMTGLIFLRMPIVHLVYEHGAFDPAATVGVADAILFYAVGLWAFAGIRIVAPVFYALQDTRTPVRVALMAMGLNIAVSLLLLGPLQHRGLALATSLAAIFQFFALFLILRRRIRRMDGRNVWGRRLWQAHWKVAASCVMIALPAVWVRQQTIWQREGAWGTKTTLFVFSVMVGVAGYGAVHALLKSEELSFLIRLVKKKRIRPAS
jgi:putative peptidoglycan lipid II flippase